MPIGCPDGDGCVSLQLRADIQLEIKVYEMSMYELLDRSLSLDVSPGVSTNREEVQGLGPGPPCSAVRGGEEEPTN